MLKFNALNNLPMMQELLYRKQTADFAQEIWESIAPDNLSNISKATGIKDQKLQIITSHNAVAAKIKFLTPSLTSKLKSLEIEVTGIQIKVQVKSIEPTKPKQQKTLSKHAAHNLNKLASELDDDSPLAKALAKIASNADR